MGTLMKKMSYVDIAKSVINLEIKALQKLKKSLNKNFDKAVNAIVNCQSKVILCGVGKSEFPNKIAATLSLHNRLFHYLQMIVQYDLGVLLKKILILMLFR